MSGEMVTSLGNGLTNWIAIESVCRNVRHSSVVEGEDGIIAVPAGTILTHDDFLKFGFDVKIQRVEHPGLSGFCGMWFLRRHDGKYCKVRDPREVLTNTGWVDPFLNQKFIKNRLAAIAMSLSYEYWGPIFNSLARYIYRRCRTCVAMTHNDWYVQEKLRNSGIDFEVKGSFIYYQAKLRSDVFVSPNIDDRLEFQKMFDIDVSTQLELEKYLDTKDNDLPLDHPALDRLFHNTEYHRFVALHKR